MNIQKAERTCSGLPFLSPADRAYMQALFYCSLLCLENKSFIVYILQVSCNVSEINDCLIAYQGEEKDDKTGISGSGFFLDG